MKDRRGEAIASMVLGIVALTLWSLPHCVGIILCSVCAFTGLVLGIRARRSSGRGMAIAGIVLSIVYFGLWVLVGGIALFYIAIFSLSGSPSGPDHSLVFLP